MSKLLTVSEVAKKLRVDDTTVRRWIKGGALEAVTLPHINKRQVYRVSEETLQHCLEQESIALSSKKNHHQEKRVEYK